jgi:hypothetical protein
MKAVVAQADGSTLSRRISQSSRQETLRSVFTVARLLIKSQTKPIFIPIFSKLY